MSRGRFAVPFLISAALWGCDGQLMPTEPSGAPAFAKGGGQKGGNTVALDGGYLAAAQSVNTTKDNGQTLAVESGTNAYTVEIALANTKAEADKTAGSLCIFDDAASASASAQETLRSLLTAGTKTWTFAMSIDKAAVAAGVGSNNNVLSVREGSATPLLRIGPNNQGETHWPVVTMTTAGSIRVFTFHAAALDAGDPLGYTGANVDVAIRLGTRPSDPIAHMTCPLLDEVRATVAPSS